MIAQGAAPHPPRPPARPRRPPLLRSAAALFLDPVTAEKRRLLAERWNALEPSLRVAGQGLGQTDTGLARLAACVFRVPVHGEMVPMCRVNAGGVRESVYAEIQGG